MAIDCSKSWSHEGLTIITPVIAGGGSVLIDYREPHVGVFLNEPLL